MKKFTVVTGNGSTYQYIAESIEKDGRFFNFIADGKIVGIKDSYGVVSISDQPYDKRY